MAWSKENLLVFVSSCFIFSSLSHFSHVSNETTSNNGDPNKHGNGISFAQAIISTCDQNRHSIFTGDTDNPAAYLFSLFYSLKFIFSISLIIAIRFKSAFFARSTKPHWSTLCHYEVTRVLHHIKLNSQLFSGQIVTIALNSIRIY